MEKIRPDGEYFVDVPTKPLQGSASWPNMTTPQLMELMVELQNKAFEFRNHATILTTIQRNIGQLDAFLRDRINSAH